MIINQLHLPSSILVTVQTAVKKKVNWLVCVYFTSWLKTVRIELLSHSLIEFLSSLHKQYIYIFFFFLFLSKFSSFYICFSFYILSDIHLTTCTFFMRWQTKSLNLHMSFHLGKQKTLEANIFILKWFS